MMEKRNSLHRHVRDRKPRVTLARCLSKFGASSRTQGRLLIGDGRVAVNGVVVRNPDHWVDPRGDRITLDGNVLKKRSFMYLALNKPAGYVTTRSDELERRTVYDLLPGEYRTLIPIGRLDKDTTGLLLFTNDTQFGEMISSPEAHIDKTYRVTTDIPLQERDRKKMETGLLLDGAIRLLPTRVRVLSKDPRVCEVILREGKNRQVRRMFEHFGLAVVALHRESIGAVKVRSLPVGKIRLLTEEEKVALRSPIKEEGRASRRKPNR